MCIAAGIELSRCRDVRVAAGDVVGDGLARAVAVSDVGPLAQTGLCGFRECPLLIR